MWKSIYASVRGTSHVAGDAPCQDACAVDLFQTQQGDLLALCCADGAGSAAHAEEGSRIACAGLMEILRRECSALNPSGALDRDLAVQWCGELRTQIAARAAELEVEIRQLSTTLLVALVDDESAVFFQIGDGAIVALDADGYVPIFWPQSGEFANATNFLTSEPFADQLEWSRLERRVDELALFTDGLERLILKFAEREVHAPFLAPLFAALRQTETPDNYFDPLRQFLDSPRVNERTDDDKTLVLATRLNAVDQDDAALR